MAVIDHSKSLEHTDAIRAMLKAKQAAPIFTTLSEKADKAVLTLMKAAYFVAKEDLVISMFGELINFWRGVGVHTHHKSFIAIVMAATNLLLLLESA